MRNTTTSFVRNAICRFANEAVQVLRAVADPAATLVRLISTAVRTILGSLVPSYRFRTSLEFETSATVSRLFGHFDISQMPGKAGANGQRGIDGWSGLLGQTVS